MTRPTVALLGLGIMGSRMARRLLDAGVPLVVYNRSPDRAAPLVALGASREDTARQAAAGAQVVLSMVSDDAASRAVWLGPDGALAGARPGSTLVESSTVTVSWVRELARAAAAVSLEVLDAPVTGSRHQAGAGELNFFVGGSAAALERVRPVLGLMARSITHLGPTGSGALMKLINNFLCGVQVAALAEALAMIERSPLDRDQAVDLLVSGAPGSPIVKTVASRILAGDFTPNFMLKLLAKDLRYAIAEAHVLSVDVSTAVNALTLFDRSIGRGDGEKDMAALVEQFRRK
ncbi:MAG: NAD(P)-dependent oxidoreductase [Acidobacteria bacterium]|nr:NAD(P)-dependent oxidoreductase [Acidobacteriota bacterium]